MFSMSWLSSIFHTIGHEPHRRVVRMQPANRRHLSLEQVRQGGAPGTRLTKYFRLLRFGVDNFHDSPTPLAALVAGKHTLGFFHRQVADVVAFGPATALAQCLVPAFCDG